MGRDLLVRLTETIQEHRGSQGNSPWLPLRFAELG
jgi:hypothetical protein